MAQVMPCAFPSDQPVQQGPKKRKKTKKSGQHNKLRNICPKEDRKEILNRIQKEQSTKQQNIDRYRKQKKAENSKAKAKLKKQQVKEEDTLDPYVVFDSRGNVSIAKFASFVRSSDDAFGAGSESVQLLPSSTLDVSTAVDTSVSVPAPQNEPMIIRDILNDNTAALFSTRDGAGSVCMETKGKIDEPTKSELPTIISSTNSFTIDAHITAGVPRDEAGDRGGVQTIKMSDEANISDDSLLSPSTNCPVNDTHASAVLSSDEMNSSLDAGSNTTAKKRNKKSKATCPSPSIQTVTRSGRIVKPKIK